ncbi:MAG: cyclic nucleotide-binding domain-containing protein [bacterium]|nr:cyclic nucleotide-binding domain-containing protein [bacterium]
MTAAADSKKKHQYKAGAYIFLEGDEDNQSVFIVEKGSVELSYSNEKFKKHKNIAGPGDIFGFISSLANRPRMVTAFAKTDSIVIELNRNNFLSLLQHNSRIALKIMNSFADRLRVYNNMIVHLEAASDNIPAEHSLFFLGKYYYNHDSHNKAYYILSRYHHLYPQGEFIEEVAAIRGIIASAGMATMKKPVVEKKHIVYSDNQLVFCEHEPGKELYILKEGRIKIVKNNLDKEIILSVLNAGDIFGELALISDKPRNASAISYGSSKLIPINMNSFLALLKQSPDILKRIFTSLAQRVWFTFIRIEAKLYEKPLTKIYAFLENKLLEDNISLKKKQPHTFNFGIDELLKMTELTQDKLGVSLNELLENPVVSFHFGQVTIDNPKEFSSLARRHKERDRISDIPGENKQMAIPEELKAGTISPQAGKGWSKSHQKEEEE